MAVSLSNSAIVNQKLGNNKNAIKLARGALDIIAEKYNKTSIEVIIYFIFISIINFYST